MLRYFPSIPNLSRVSFINSWKHVFCQMISLHLLTSQYIIWFLSFRLSMQCIILIDLCVLNYPCIPRINPTWSWYMFLLTSCLILLELCSEREWPSQTTLRWSWTRHSSLNMWLRLFEASCPDLSPTEYYQVTSDVATKFSRLLQLNPA